MANAFYAVTSFQTIQVGTGNTVQDVEYVICSTIPTGIGFAYPVALGTWRADRGVQVLEPMAVELENLVTNGHVVGGDATQSIDVNGLLQDAVDLIVEVDRSAQGRLPLQGTVSLPMPNLFLWTQDNAIAEASGLQTPAQIVGEEYTRLQALAAA